MSDPGTNIRIIPVHEVPWSDVQTVFGTRGDPSTCWCQWFKESRPRPNGPDASACETALREQAELAPGPGLIAYVEDVPAGWVAVEPRPAYPRLRSARVVQRGSHEAPDDLSVWAVTCFVVRVGFRRRGIGAALLCAAVSHATGAGARVLEAYPVDTAEKKTSSADLYHGPLSSFLAAGFEVVSRPQTGRAVVRLSL